MLAAAAVVLAAAAVMLVLSGPFAPARAADASLEVLDFYAYPKDNTSFNKLEGYKWPAVQNLSALVHVKTDGYSGERDVNLFFVVMDSEDNVITKIKQKHPLPTGEHDLVVPDFIDTADYFGKHTFHLKLELSMKGAGLQKGETAVDITGPAPPNVEIRSITVYNPEGGYRDKYFEPGNTFMVEAAIGIGPNPTGVHPTITIYGAMDEDADITNPDGDYETYYKQWSSVESDFSTGLVRVRATGWLPHFFADPWEYYHPFKIYVLMSFGPGADYADFATGTLFDSVGGDVRRTDDVQERLIEISPGYNWDVKPGRTPFDEPSSN